MKLRIDFHGSEIPSVDFQSKSHNSKVFEILPVGGSRIRRQEVSARYLTEIDYGIKGVKNNADDYISELYVEIPNIDTTIIKSGSSVNQGLDDIVKYKTVIYDIAPGIIIESLYITKGVTEETLTHKNGEISGEEISKIISNHLNTDIIQKDSDNVITINIGILMAIVEKYIKGYSLRWNSLINAFQIVETGKSTVSYNHIKADDTYTFFRLLGLILDKGRHHGVFYIRAESYRSEVLEAMLKMIELLYRDKYIVFLYNADITSKRIEREVIEVPNYLSMGGRKDARK